VRVKTSTLESNGSTQVPFVMAPVMNAVTGGTVRASATVAWGTAAGALVVPFVMSLCEFNNLGGSFDGLTFPQNTGYIYYHGKNMNDPNAGNCIPSPSGQRIPGGFGRVDSTNCSASFVAGQWAGSDTGNNLAQGCPITTWQGQEIVISLYDQVQGSGNNGQYHIIGFVGFKLMGYRLGGNNTYATSTCPLTGSSSLSYFCGRFTKVALSLGDFGGNTNYGASVVKIVG
jgi:hypothetical protein